MSTVKPIPGNSSALIPMLVCRDVAAELDFCASALGAVELGRRRGPDGSVVHALLSVGGAMVIVEAEWPTLATARILDPAGHVWTIATCIEETSVAEREQRWSEIVEDRT